MTYLFVLLSRRSHWRRFFWLALCLAGIPWFGHAAPRPNIVLVLADDLGWGDLGCYNRDSKIPTPHLDRLAAEGMRFTDAHTPSGVCTPTRYGLMTGRYAWRTRLKSGVLWGYSPPLLEPNRLTLPAMLRQRGYTTACVGKWHLGLGWPTREQVEFGDKFTPAADPGLVDYARPLRAGPHTAGFDYSFVLPASLDMEPYVFIENGRVVGVPDSNVAASKHQRQGGEGFWRAGPVSPGFTHENCQPELLAKATEFLQRQTSRQPFFLYFPLTSPHDPWVPTREFLGKSQTGARGDFVAQVDAMMGRLLAVLGERGLAKNTLVIFTSDNGAHWLPDEIERTGHRANGPWRGQKSDAWEGGHRVPFIARWPGKIKPGTESPALICLTDLMATFAEITRAKLPENASEDGESFLRALRGRSRTARESLVMHSINGTFAIRRGPWKLIEGRNSGGWTKGETAEPAQLYNLAGDPAEQHNQFNQRSEIVQELRERLARFQQDGKSRAR